MAREARFASVALEGEAAVEDGIPVLNVFPDGSPDGRVPFASGFALSEDVKLMWIE